VGIRIPSVGGVLKPLRLIASGVEALRNYSYRLVSELSFAALTVPTNPKGRSSTHTTPSCGVDISFRDGSLIP
jgi:hypothetical protein